MHSFAVGFKKDTKEFLVFLDDKALKSGKYRLEKTSRNQVKAAVNRNELVGFTINGNRIMHYNKIKRLLIEELHFDKNLANQAMTVLLELKFSHHKCSDTIH